MAEDKFTGTEGMVAASCEVCRDCALRLPDFDLGDGMVIPGWVKDGCRHYVDGSKPVAVSFHGAPCEFKVEEG